MRRFIQFLFIFNVLWNLNAQQVYLLTGSNFSTYKYTNATIPLSTELKSGTGSTLELGFSKQLPSEQLHYAVGINLNEYNALAGSQVTNYRWNTKYLGIQNAINYALSFSEKFQLNLEAGFSLATIIYGRQEINGNVFDLRKQEEFSGLSIAPFARLQMNFKVSDLAILSLGYGINKSIFLANDSQEKLSINTSQILFGIHFNIQ